MPNKSYVQRCPACGQKVITQSAYHPPWKKPPLVSTGVHGKAPLVSSPK